jgi:serine/threonine protein kinase
MDDERLAEIVNGLLDRLNAGETIDLEKDLPSDPEARRKVLDLLPELAHRGPIGDGEPGEGSEVRDLGGEGSFPIQAGLRIADYEILEKIGAGGMGIVYKARQASLGRIVALKVLPFPDLSAEDLARFRREARLAARLRHPGIVSVHSLESVQGLHFYTMEYVAGRSLKAVLRDLVSGETPREVLAASGSPDQVRERLPRWAAGVALQAARALEHAHASGIIHRDVKPSNLLLDAVGKVSLCDFGLARDLFASFSFTATGEIAGTLAYMSPEQAEGRRGVDRRTDVYSLSLTLYEALTLKQPFLGDSTNATLAGILAGSPPRPRDLNPKVPLDLEAIVWKGMARRKEDRYESCGALADDLERFLGGKPVSAPRITKLREALWRARRRKREIVLAVILAAVAAFAVFSWVLPRIDRAFKRSQIAGKLDAAWSKCCAGDFASALKAVDDSRVQEAGDLVLSAMGKYIQGACKRRLPESDLKNGRDDFASAYYYGGDTEWGRRALLAIADLSNLEGNTRPLREWVPGIDPAMPESRGLEGGLAAAAAEAKLLRAKYFLEIEDYEEATWLLEEIEELPGEDGLVLAEAGALRKVLEGEFLRPVTFQRRDGLKRPRGKPAGLRLVELDGRPGPEVVVLTKEELDAYRLVQGRAEDLPADGSGNPKLSKKSKKCYILEEILHGAHVLEEGRESPPVLGAGDLDGDGKEELVIAVHLPNPQEGGKPGNKIHVHVLGFRDSSAKLEVLSKEPLELSGKIDPLGLCIVPRADNGIGEVFIALWSGEEADVIQTYRFRGGLLEKAHPVLDGDGRPTEFFAEALSAVDLDGADGDPGKELIAAVIGPRESGYGLRVFGRDTPGGEFRFRAGYLMGSTEGKKEEKARRAAFSNCLAADVDPGLPGLELIGCIDGNQSPDDVKRWPGLDLGGIIPCRYVPDRGEKALLVPLGFRDLALRAIPGPACAANMHGDARHEVLVSLQDMGGNTRLALYLFGERANRFWRWSFLKRQRPRDSCLCIDVDADGGSHREALCLFEEECWILDLTPDEEGGRS